jgi:pyrroloquinoline-quinone synthase
MYHFIQQLKKTSSLDTNIYFSSMKSTKTNGIPALSKNTFIAGQLDFLGAVEYFSLPMMILCSRTKEFSSRWSILSNIVEEHGHGTCIRTHKSTFITFLQQLDVSSQTIEHHTYHPCIDIFNHTLSSICQTDHPYVGVACLGIIEELFADISFRIGSFLITSKWLTEDQLIHYTTHKDLDVQHAEDFYTIILPYWKTHSSEIKKGLQIGHYLFYHLYEQLYHIHKNNKGM